MSGEEELLELVPRRVPRWAWLAGLAVVCLVVVWLVAHDRRAATPNLPAAAPPTVPSVAASTPPVPFVAGESLHDQLLVYVYERAQQRQPAGVRTTVSSMSCTRVPAGLRPRQHLEHYVHTQFPHLRITDEIRTVDRADRLCILELRARDDTGSILVVRIVAPIEDAPIVAPRTDQASVFAAGSYTRYVQVMSREDWIVLAGVSGPADSGPSQTALLDLASQRSLRW